MEMEIDKFGAEWERRRIVAENAELQSLVRNMESKMVKSEMGRIEELDCEEKDEDVGSVIERIKYMTERKVRRIEVQIVRAQNNLINLDEVYNSLRSKVKKQEVLKQTADLNAPEKDDTRPIQVTNELVEQSLKCEKMTKNIKECSKILQLLTQLINQGFNDINTTPIDLAMEVHDVDLTSQKHKPLIDSNKQHIFTIGADLFEKFVLLNESLEASKDVQSMKDFWKALFLQGINQLHPHVSVLRCHFKVIERIKVSLQSKLKHLSKKLRKRQHSVKMELQNIQAEKITCKAPDVEQNALDTLRTERATLAKFIDDLEKQMLQEKLYEKTKIVEVLHVLIDDSNALQEVKEEPPIEVVLKPEERAPCKEPDEKELRRLVLEDIVSTEKVFVENLREVMNVYLLPMKSQNLLGLEIFHVFYDVVCKMSDLHSATSARIDARNKKRPNPSFVYVSWMKFWSSSEVLDVHLAYLKCYPDIIGSFIYLAHNDASMNSFLKVIYSSTTSQKTEMYQTKLIESRPSTLLKTLFIFLKKPLERIHFTQNSLNSLIRYTSKTELAKVKKLELLFSKLNKIIDHNSFLSIISSLQDKANTISFFRRLSPWKLLSTTLFNYYSDIKLKERLLVLEIQQIDAVVAAKLKKARSPRQLDTKFHLKGAILVVFSDCVVLAVAKSSSKRPTSSYQSELEVHALLFSDFYTFEWMDSTVALPKQEDKLESQKLLIITEKEEKPDVQDSGVHVSQCIVKLTQPEKLSHLGEAIAALVSSGYSASMKHCTIPKDPVPKPVDTPLVQEVDRSIGRPTSPQGTKMLSGLSMVEKRRIAQMRRERRQSWISQQRDHELTDIARSRIMKRDGGM